MASNFVSSGRRLLTRFAEALGASIFRESNFGAGPGGARRARLRPAIHVPVLEILEFRAVENDNIGKQTRRDCMFTECAISTRHAHLLPLRSFLRALLHYQKAIAPSLPNFSISLRKMLISSMLLLHEPVIQRPHFSPCSRHILMS